LTALRSNTFSKRLFLLGRFGMGVEDEALDGAEGVY